MVKTINDWYSEAALCLCNGKNPGRTSIPEEQGERVISFHNKQGDKATKVQGVTESEGNRENVTEEEE